jgi:7,8-dihydropterin-6-yl-methyl-4-(beta-D-ribofuranosyl)aminobenzene 5'-phosphate synthase
LSGEVKLVVPADFDSRHLAGDGELRQDTYEDEQCLVVRNGNSISVLVGCAHRGLENNVRAAMNVEGVDRIDLIAGGFHLGGTSEDSLEALVGFLRSVDVGRIACCHCTRNSAYEYMRSKLGPRVTLGRTGASWTLSDVLLPEVDEGAV